MKCAPGASCVDRAPRRGERWVCPGPGAGRRAEATAIRGYVTVKGGDVPSFDFTSGSWVVTREGSRRARRAAEAWVRWLRGGNQP